MSPATTNMAASQGVLHTNADKATVETLPRDEQRDALRQFMSPDNLKAVVQMSGIPEQLRSSHTIRGSFLDSRSRAESDSKRAVQYTYDIKPIGDVLCVAAAYQPYLRVDHSAEVQGLLALAVRMTIQASDRQNKSQIEVSETLWIPIRKGSPVNNLRGLLSPCQDGEYYTVQLSNNPPGIELLVRAVERSNDGKYIVFDGSSPDGGASNPGRWDPSRSEARVYPVSGQGCGDGPLRLDLRRGDSFDGRQITYQAGSDYHPARDVGDQARLHSPTPAVIPIVAGRPLAKAFGMHVISAHGPWHLGEERKFSGLLELARARGSRTLVLVHENRAVLDWNHFDVRPLKTIEAPGAHVAALVSLTSSVSSDRQQRPNTLVQGATTPAKAAIPDTSQSRTVPFVDGTMITTVALDASGQRAEIIEVLMNAPDGREVPLEIRAGAVWRGTLLLKVPFNDATWVATIQAGRVATTDRYPSA